MVSFNYSILFLCFFIKDTFQFHLSMFSFCDSDEKRGIKRYVAELFRARVKKLLFRCSAVYKITRKKSGRESDKPAPFVLSDR